MSESPAETALEAIRALELEQAQQIENERVEAEAAVAAAHRAARRVVGEARDRGAEQAEQTYEERVAAARAEAERIEIDAVAGVDRLLRRIRPRLTDLVEQMLEKVLTTQMQEEP
ncbi:MAG: hypothetical protein OEU32_12465 [Acidimicrobiia bacterium]|nr:hypothetical protein [Acidimicrobiia bacterium]